MRLIDADALKKVFERYINAPHVRFFEEMAVAIDTCNRFLDNAKTIDAVPVVRCKDCVHYYDRDPVCLKIYSDGNVSSDAWQERKPDDFCSYGERKDGVEL